jgi:chemotaxis response regulator CheB
MKHITFADKSLLLGDEAADALVEYAALIAKTENADSVTLTGFGADGQEVEATYVLDRGTVLMAESSHTSMNEPENGDAVMQMREKIMRLSSPEPVRPSNETMPVEYDDLGLDEF